MLHSEPCNMYANSAGPDRVQKSCRYFFLFDFDSKLEARNEQKRPRNSLVVWVYAWEAISNTGREEKDTFAVTQARERKVPAIKSFAHLHSDPAHLTSSRDPSSPKKMGRELKMKWKRGRKIERERKKSRWDQNPLIFFHVSLFTTWGSDGDPMNVKRGKEKKRLVIWRMLLLLSLSLSLSLSLTYSLSLSLFLGERSTFRIDSFCFFPSIFRDWRHVPVSIKDRGKQKKGHDMLFGLNCLPKVQLIVCSIQESIWFTNSTAQFSSAVVICRPDRLPTNQKCKQCAISRPWNPMETGGIYSFSLSISAAKSNWGRE